MGHSWSLARSPPSQAQHDFQPALPPIPAGISAGCGLLGLLPHTGASTGCGGKPISQGCCAQSSFPVSSSWSQHQNECKQSIKGLHPHASPMQYIFGNQDRAPDQTAADYCPTSAAAHEVSHTTFWDSSCCCRVCSCSGCQALLPCSVWGGSSPYVSRSLGTFLEARRFVCGCLAHSLSPQLKQKCRTCSGTRCIGAVG